MESLQPQLEDLTSSIDDLESALQPILTTALSTSTSKLPLLDKAKLYVLATYALESILFSYLRLNGVEAKSHAVFQELSRVKEYFGKIKTAEEIGAGGRSGGKLDRAAAARFIKHGLAGNEKYDRERDDRRERERAGAKRKFDNLTVGTHTRFDGSAKRIKAAEEKQTVNVVSADALEEDVDEEDQEDEDSDDGDVTIITDGPSETSGETGGRRKNRKKPKKKRGPLESATRAQREGLVGSGARATPPVGLGDDDGDPFQILEGALQNGAAGKAPGPAPASKDPLKAMEQWNGKTEKRKKKKKHAD